MHRGITAIEAIVVLAILVILIGILIPAIFPARRTARSVQNSTQPRGIHQGMVIFSQSNKTGSTEGWFPGVDPAGQIIDATPAYRFQVLIEANAFTPEYMISPVDEGKTEWDYGPAPVTTDHFSYAMLDIDAGGGRFAEWRDTINTQAAVLSDRNTGAGPGPDAQSLWSDHGWRGSVVHNDNSTGFVASPVLEETQYGDAPMNETDDLFAEVDHNDGLMVYSGP